MEPPHGTRHLLKSRTEHLPYCNRVEIAESGHVHADAQREQRQSDKHVRNSYTPMEGAYPWVCKQDCMYK